MNYQLKLFDTFEYLTDFEKNDKVKFLKLLNQHINFYEFIPKSFFSAYNKSIGRPPYPLISMIKALFLKNIFGYPKMSMLIDLISVSPEVRKFCEITTVPDKSKFSRFRSNYSDEIEKMFDHLVNLTEPICRKLGENFASHLIYDTSGIKPYVKENNDRYFNQHLKKIKSTNKNKPKEEIYKMAYGSMPKKSEANPNIKLSYINGSYNYAYKFGLFTNAFGVPRHIAFLDDDFKEKHPELSKNYSSDTLYKQKTIGDSKLLEPLLSDFFSKIDTTKFNYHTFLADSALDKYEHYSMLINDFNFDRALIPINTRNTSKKTSRDDYFINKNGIPVCSKFDIPFKNGGISREKNRSTRHKFNCPKTKLVNRKLKCYCESPCTDSKYGRTVYTYPNQDLRLYPGILRGSDHYKEVYSRRTIIERTNHLYKNVMGIGNSLQRDHKSFKSDLYMCGITQLVTLILADKITMLDKFKGLSNILKVS